MPFFHPANITTWWPPGVFMLTTSPGFAFASDTRLKFVLAMSKGLPFGP